MASNSRNVYHDVGDVIDAIFADSESENEEFGDDSGSDFDVDDGRPSDDSSESDVDNVVNDDGDPHPGPGGDAPAPVPVLEEGLHLQTSDGQNYEQQIILAWIMIQILVKYQG